MGIGHAASGSGIMNIITGGMPRHQQQRQQQQKRQQVWTTCMHNEQHEMLFTTSYLQFQLKVGSRVALSHPLKLGVPNCTALPNLCVKRLLLNRVRGWGRGNKGGGSEGGEAVGEREGMGERGEGKRWGEEDGKWVGGERRMEREDALPLGQHRRIVWIWHTSELKLRSLCLSSPLKMKFIPL